LPNSIGGRSRSKKELHVAKNYKRDSYQKENSDLIGSARNCQARTRREKKIDP